MRNAADRTRDDADTLEVESERLRDDVGNAEIDLESYEETAAEDQRLADEVAVHYNIIETFLSSHALFGTEQIGCLVPEIILQFNV